jgi:hypothetical protein
MSRRRWEIAISTGAEGRHAIAIAWLTVVLAALLAAPARANPGYELDTVSPTVSVGAEKVPHGLAVDQANRRLYVAVMIGDTDTFGPGEVRRFESDGTPAGTFVGSGNAYFGGVAVDPATQGFFANEVKFEMPFGDFGTMRMNPFTSAGVWGTPFPLNSVETAPTIAIDSNSDIYFPNDTTNTVQVFSTTGTIEEEIACGGCPSGAFGRPVSIALGSDDDLYVVDLAPNRVLKFILSEGSYKYASTVQTGGGAAAVAVDSTTDDVLVGALSGGSDYHILAYDSSGTQFDDFGADLISPPAPFDARGAFQLAIDETSHELYAGTLEFIYVFDRVTSTPPSVSTNAASTVGQMVATLNATVNPQGHAVFDCDLEYVDDAEFLVNGFANATALPCSKKPDGMSSVAVNTGLTGLTPATKYHYRAVATSYAGSTTGSTTTFTTLPSLPPTVLTDPATNVTQTSATLNGRVNPHGGTVTDCHFEFGATSAYGSSTPCSPSVGPITTEALRKFELKNLSVGTTYHYRLVVTTNAGTTEGADVAFTTLLPEPPPPPPVTPTVAPPPPVVPPPVLKCRSGFVKKWVGGKYACVRKCPKGTVRRRVRGKYRCVKRSPARRANRRQLSRADRR